MNHCSLHLVGRSRDGTLLRLRLLSLLVEHNSFVCFERLSDPPERCVYRFILPNARIHECSSLTHNASHSILGSLSWSCINVMRIFRCFEIGQASERESTAENEINPFLFRLLWQIDLVLRFSSIEHQR